MIKYYKNQNELNYFFGYLIVYPSLNIFIHLLPEHVPQLISSRWEDLAHESLL